MNPFPEGTVDHFANLNPTPDDIKSVKSLVEQLLKDPSLGTPIPFEKEKYKGCYVAFTAGGRWRVVYRPSNPADIVVISIERQEE
jgi:hypothetical protein